MKNYTSTEIQEMQREAIERVREMQRRSQMTRQQASFDLGETVESRRTPAEPVRQTTAPRQNETQRQPSAQQGNTAPPQQPPIQQPRPAAQPTASWRQSVQPQKQQNQNEIRTKIPDTPRRISLPVELPESTKLTNRSAAAEETEPAAITLRDDFEEEAEATASTQASASEAGGTGGGFLDEIDSEKALILALVLLLSGEGADLELILALLYIMY